MRAVSMSIPFLLLFLFLLLPLSHAAILLDRNVLTWAMGATAFIVTILLAITYLMSGSLSMPQLEAWTKVELRELIVAAALFVIVNAIFFGSTPLLQTLTGRTNAESAAGDYLDDIRTDTQNAYNDMVRLFHMLTLRSGFSVLAATPPPYTYASITAAPYSGAGLFFGPLSMASQGLTNAWFAYSGLYILYEFLLRASGVLLPLAFIVRFIPFTRSLGNTLLALALGAKVLLPFSILLVAQFHGLASVPTPNVSEEVFNRLELSPLVLPFAAICSNTFTRVLLSSSELGFALIGCLPVIWLPGAFWPCFEALIHVYPILETAFRSVYSTIFASMGLLNTPTLAGGGLGAALGAAGGGPGGMVAGGFSGARAGQAALGPYFLSGSEISDMFYPFLLAINNFVLMSYVDILIIALITYVGTKSISSALGGEYLMPAVSRLVR